MPAHPSFEDRLKTHLAHWAENSGLGLQNDGVHGWVLAKASARRNFYLDDWATFIAGKEHQWAHALNSSQAFAVNLFAPAKISIAASMRLWNFVWPKGTDGTPERVVVEFEYSGPASKNLPLNLLGERGHATQIDVALCATFAESPPRYVLIEVKLRETEFGTCRGARQGGDDCKALDKVLASAETKCWMSREEHRTYWPVLQSGLHPLQFYSPGSQPCPWRGSLYQVMRNWAFGQVLVASSSASDFRVGVCVHPGNDKALKLNEPVAGRSNVFEAFDAMTPEVPLIRVSPRRVVDLLDSVAPDGWAGYMRSRYMLDS